MEIGIVGFNGSGKTTVFGALSGAVSASTQYSGGKIEPHVGVVHLKEEGVDALCEFFHSKKKVEAMVKYTDLPGASKESLKRREGLDSSQIQYIGSVDALIVVIRAFDQGDGLSGDPAADIESFNLELLLTDLLRVENRMPKIEKSVKKLSGKVREELEREYDVLTKVKSALDDNRSVRSITLSDNERRLLRSFSLLTEKPVLYVLNIGEDDLSSDRDLASEIKDQLGICGEGEDVAQMCAEIEMEIAQLGEEEQAAFMKDFGISEPASMRIVRRSFDVANLITFFTASEKEVRSWVIKAGTPAAKAAGTIHSDFERGFIRAEVVNWKTLLECGSYSEAKKQAHMKFEGKEYIVQQGDVIGFLFNV